MTTKRPTFIFFYLLLFFILTPLFLGFLNFLHPLLDSFSHFRIQLLYLVLPLLFILMLLHEKKYRVVHLMLFIIFALYLYLVSQPFQPSLEQHKSKNFKHMQFNLNFRNQKMEKFTEFIKNNPMDIITLQEVTDEHREKLEKLKVDGLAIELSRDFPFLAQKKGEYPYQAYCNFRAVGAVAVLSKHPFETEAVCLNGAIWAKVLLDDKAINVLSTHLYWPYPHHQPAQVKELLPVLEGIPSPTLISGDFNAVGWSHAVKQIASASHTYIVDGLRWSIELKTQLPLLPFMKLPIDHLLLSDEFEVKSIKIEDGLGSDHLPIVTEIGY
jgi:endonuclease/exonuclease/phosphatase (EEP) superfamily protein YafD